MIDPSSDEYQFSSSIAQFRLKCSLIECANHMGHVRYETNKYSWLIAIDCFLFLLMIVVGPCNVHACKYCDSINSLILDNANWRMSILLVCSILWCTNTWGNGIKIPMKSLFISLSDNEWFEVCMLSHTHTAPFSVCAYYLYYWKYIR